jgi:hypothetical protein
MSDTTPTPSAEDAVDEFKNAVELARATAVDATTGTDLVISNDTAVATKARFASAYSQVARANEAAMALRETAQVAINAKKQELEAMMRAAEAQLAPMREMMDRMQDGMNAVNLYLGRDEYIEELRDGAAASAGTPLSVRQSVLAMDEEAALLAEEGGIDAEKIDTFIEWLLADDKNLDQVIPEKKGVVTIIPKRKPRDYGKGDHYNAQMAEENAKTWWIIRNGEKLWLMTTEFSVGSRLLPDQGTFAKLFQVRNYDGSTRTMEPGTAEWINAEKTASAINRHYMKVALILQGLIDRTAVFHPLPERGLNLLGEADYIEGNIVRIEDDFNAIGTGRPTFREWQKAALANLDVGHRVIGHFASYFGKEETNRIHPKNASGPARNVVHTIIRKDAHYLYFTYDRTDSVYRDYSYSEAKTRATYKLDREPWGAVSYLPLDNISAEEMEYYLGSRSERHEYLNMFPAIHAAIQVKADEELAEQPFRTLLSAALLAENLIAADDADAATRELVTWWKTANKWHRALNGEPDHERRAQSGILREARRREATKGAASIADKIRAAVPSAMVIAARSSDIVAVEAQPRRYGVGSVPQNLWVRIHEFTAKGKPRQVSEWKTLTRAQVAKWTVLHQTEAWDGWLFNSTPKSHLTDPAIDELFETVKADCADNYRTPLAIKYEERLEGQAPRLTVHFESHFNSSGSLVQPYRVVGVNVENGHGIASFSWTSYLSDTSWRSTGSRHTNGVAESPHTVNYYGSSAPAAIAFIDDEAMARDAARGAEWHAQYVANSKRQSATWTLHSTVERAWIVAEEEGRRARFIEDYGDAGLWDGHKKTQRAAQWKAPEGLNDMLSAIVDNDIAVAGLSVAEAMALTDVEIELSDDVLSLRFPEGKAE